MNLEHNNSMNWNTPPITYQFSSIVPEFRHPAKRYKPTGSQLTFTHRDDEFTFIGLVSYDILCM